MTSESEVRLHPLTVLNVADHHTRARANLDKHQDKTNQHQHQLALGALLGETHGSTISITNSFEFKTHDAHVDYAFVTSRYEQYKKNFPQIELLGWYAVGKLEHARDFARHEALGEALDVPVDSLMHLTLDPDGFSSASATGDLPIHVYTVETSVVDDKPKASFVATKYEVDSVESERTAVEHVAHILPSGGGSAATAFSEHIDTQRTALEMLIERVDVLRRYVAAVEANRLPLDSARMRQIKSVCASLPAIDSELFVAQSTQERNNTLHVGLLATLTRAIGLANETVERFNHSHERAGGRRRGLF